MSKNRINRIKPYRMDHGLTQMELAARLGVAEATVQDWENGRRIPRMATLFRMTEIFGCRTEDLYPRDGA